MIEYPDDRRSREVVQKHDLTNAVLVRDIVRVVEVLNLKTKDFFSKRSVLSGSMALRCFGSPRFTVFDADFSTTRPESNDDVVKQFRYQDDELSITPERFKADTANSLMQIMPVNFDPVFTRLQLAEKEKRFKADVSFRGLECDGLEVELITPYDLGLWVPGKDRRIWVMQPVETLAEKILGWVVHQKVKHFADIAWITHQAWVDKPPAPAFAFTGKDVKDLLDVKLTTMRKLQSDLYEPYPTVDAVINKLGQEAVLPRSEWAELMYLKDQRARWTQDELKALVSKTLVRQLRAAGR